jgi:hypothetical protein
VSVATSATATWSRVIRQRNPFLQTLSGYGPTCPKNAFNVAMGTCIDPKPTDDDGALVSGMDPAVIKQTSFWYTKSNGTPTTLPGASEWTVAPAGQEGSAGTVYFLTSAPKVLWDGDTGPVDAGDIVVDLSGAADPAVFGIQKVTWAENYLDDNSVPAVKKRRLSVLVKYLYAFTWTITGTAGFTSRLPGSSQAPVAAEALPAAAPLDLGYQTTDPANVPAYSPPPTT